MPKKGLEKNEWIEYQINNGGSRDVIEFIEGVIESSGEKFRNAFADDYSYYFANMLKLAFNRGEIYWHRNYHHIVWKDDDGKTYDVFGVYKNRKAEFVPFSHLGNMGQLFKLPGIDTINFGCPEFVEWCNNKRINPITTIMAFYTNSEEMNDSTDVISNALAYWRLHEDDLNNAYNAIARKDNEEV